MADVNIGEIAASTMEFYHNTFVDNIFKKHVTLDHLKQNGGVKLYPGGRLIRVPLMYRTSNTVQRVNGAESLDLTYQDTLDAAEYNYELYNVSITLTLEDELKNSGESAVMSLLEAKIKQAELSLSEGLNTDLFTGTAADGDIIGLDTIMSTSTTIGGISGTTYAWWRANVDATSETLSIADMRTKKNSANKGNGGSKVSLIVTTQTLFEKYQSLCQASIVMNQPATSESKRIADAGFTGVEFEGVPVVFDESSTSGSMYFINKDNLKLGIHRDANFARRKKAEPADQHLYVEHIVAYCQTVVDRRGSLSLLSNKTA